jgi:Cell wall binding domain 2 (CWB2)
LRGVGRKNQPINADVLPQAEKPADAAVPTSPPEIGARPAEAANRRLPLVPGALKLIGALILIAVVFIIAAIVGGSDEGNSIPGAAPSGEGTAPEQTTEPPAATEPAEDLGYPQFATNNTTRVGGADPASNAAGVALAVFPSESPEQRPGAVVLVDEADWESAIAAAVLMADPIRAPLLISGAAELPEPTATALDALSPGGSDVAKGAQAFAIGGAVAPGGLQTTRVNGTAAEAAATIAKLRDKLFGGPPRHVIVAPAAQPEFAMPAAAWAARSGDPVLYSNRDSLPEPTVEALKRHPRVPVYVLGPSSAISSEVVRQIARIDNRVRRVSGEDPVTNAIALARYDDNDFGWNVNDPGHGFVVTRSDSPLDAVAAAPLSASGTWGPLLLTDSADTLPAALRDYLLDVKPGYSTDPTRAFYNHVWVIGDQDAIDVTQQAEIDELAELAKIGGNP